MTDQTIIDYAIRCGIFSKEHNLVLLTEDNIVERLTKFAQLHEARAKASKQAQGEAVAIVDVEGKIHLNMTALNAIRKAGKEINLYASPPQLQTVADALEMAAKVCLDKKSHAEKQYGVAESVGADMCYRAIKNLITTQPPIQGNIKGEK